MRGSLKVSIVSAFWLLLLAWGNTPVVAMPIANLVAQTTADGINRPPLKAGEQGVAVSELQAALKLLGYYTGAVDGVYRQSTVIAVSQFQQAAGLNPDGIVNSGTWERLFPPASPRASSAAAFPVPAATTPPPATANTTTNNTGVTNSKPSTAAKPTTDPSASKPKPAATKVNLSVLRLGMEGATVKRLQQRLQAVGLFKDPVDGIFGSQTESAVKAVQRRYRLKPDGVVGAATWKVLERQPPIR